MVNVIFNIMTEEIIHASLLIIAIIFSFVYAKTDLSNYAMQFSAGFFIVFFLAKKLLIKKDSTSRLLESVVFTLIVLIIVNTTGGTQSQYFFLVYFLLFSLSLLVEPVVSIITSLSLIVFFLLNLPENQNINTLLPIFSLAFLTPFALFLGQEHEKNIRLKEDSFLFLSLIIKNHLQNIKEAVDNFMGDHDLTQIKKSLNKMEKLIEDYENKS